MPIQLDGFFIEMWRINEPVEFRTVNTFKDVQKAVADRPENTYFIQVTMMNRRDDGELIETIIAEYQFNRNGKLRSSQLIFTGLDPL